MKIFKDIRDLSVAADLPISFIVLILPACMVVVLVLWLVVLLPDDRYATTKN